MEYISAEEFLKQTEEIQKIFIDWWEPNEGDLLTTKRVYDEIDVIIDVTENDIWGMNNTFKGNIYSSVDKSLELFPLLTEGQLRKFIEDKTGFPIQAIEFTDKHEEYQIMTAYKTIDNYRDFWFHERLGNDLLQAYWKVALEIAKEEIKEEI
jgi:hypothetical protein